MRHHKWKTLWTADLPLQEIDKRFQKLTDFSKVPKNHTDFSWLTKQWCRDIICHIDKVYCNGILFQDHQVDLRVHLASKRPHVFESDELKLVAAMVFNHGLRQKLYVNDLLLNKLFKTEKFYYVFGIIVKTPLESVLHILLHEYVHMFLNVARYFKVYDWKHDHGPEFMHKINKWYGHTDFEVGLIPGLQSNQLMIQVKVGDKVRLFIDDNTHVIGVIHHMENNRISVVGYVYPENRQASLTTHVGRIVAKC